MAFATSHTHEQPASLNLSVPEMQELCERIDGRTLQYMLTALAGVAADNQRGDAVRSTVSVSPFTSRYLPPVSVVAYGRRLLKYNYCPPLGIVLGIVLLARYCKATDHVPTPHTIHRLLLTAVVVALKTHFDVFYSNAYYAQVGGVTNSELNRLEASFLNSIHFGAIVSLHEVIAVSRSLSKAGAKIPMDSNLELLPATAVDGESAAAATHSIRASAHALLMLPDAPLPFSARSRGTPAVPLGQPTAAVSVSPARAPLANDERTRVTEWARPHVPVRPVASVASGLDGDYVDTCEHTSHPDSRRTSRPASAMATPLC